MPLARLLLVLACAALTATSALAQDAAPKRTSPAPKTKAPNPVFAPITDTPGLPRVLLIGDSISMGYTLPVRAALAGRANVHRPPVNCGDTARGVQSVDAWLGTSKWDVIHFNFGLHDLKSLDASGQLADAAKGGKLVASVEVYEANLRKIVARLKQTGAKVIFATTTPVPAGTVGRPEHAELPYNAAAVRVMRELGVAVNDLHAFVKTRQAELQRPANVHFSDTGSARLAEVVVAALAPALPAAAR